MARIKIEFPEKVVFQTQLDIRITDLNFAGHVGNDKFMSLVHEARAQFFKAHGWSELNVEGVGIALADTAIVFKRELFYGDSLLVELMLGGFSPVGCDIFYRLIHVDSGREAAHAKTAIVFFNYSERKIAPMPAAFGDRFM
ncbi:MAG: thioesterase family protein [Chloroherpetonaceae bacterium]|nr:thioesterase family protein [Chloroherpetonaceae bacterium]